MRTVEKTVYTFDELEENIQEKVIEKYADVNVQDDWYWSVYDYAEEQFGYEGFKDVEINFTGFWSQGDGASFTATLELPVIIKSLIEKYAKDAKKVRMFKRLLKLDEHDLLGTCTITRHDMRYCHERTCSVSLNTYSNVLEDEHDTLEEEIDTLYIDWCYKLYRMLEQEYEGMTSRESIEETILCNEWEFYQDGTPYYAV